MHGRDMRRHERILVPGRIEIRVTGRNGAADVEGLATVIGYGGMFLRTTAKRSPGEVLQLALTCRSISVELEGTVRHVAEKGAGVEFTLLDAENEQKLRALLLQLHT